MQGKLGIDLFDTLLEHDLFIQRQRERAYQEGLAIGKAKALREILIGVVEQRFPSLKDLAQQGAEQMV